MSYRNTRKAFALRRAVAGRLLAACALLPVPPGPASAATCSAEENVVCTDVGAVRGVREAFKGIPYAKPPVAALRWRPPEPPAACTFGGPDGKTLYITARSRVYRMRMTVGSR